MYISYICVYVCVHAKSLHSFPILCNPMDAHQAHCPWDSPGKNTGLGHCSLLQVYMYIWYLLMNVEKVEKRLAMKITLLKDIKLICPSWVAIHGMAYYFIEHLIISKHLLLLY